MYTGWWVKFPVNRPLTQREREDALSHERQPGVVPNQRMGMIQINSTYMDWIDPIFSNRGMINSAGLLFGSMTFVIAFLGFIWLTIIDAGGARGYFLFIALFMLPWIALLYYGGLRFEFFTYVYYPIRFNRIDRKIHVFKHNGKNGVLTVPWDDVFFHIGYDIQSTYQRNIRGEILDGDIVKETFALGLDAENNQEIYDRWEFIRRYMDEGPEAVADSPLDKYVDLSVSSSWDNGFIFAAGNCDATTPSKRFWRAPFIYLYAATRWLIFKTCKVPVFPPDIELESAVAPDDPNIWPIPEHTNQFEVTIPAVGARIRERLRQSRNPKATASDNLPFRR